jgi:hypothetical protein
VETSATESDFAVPLQARSIELNIDVLAEGASGVTNEP